MKKLFVLFLVFAVPVLAQNIRRYDATITKSGVSTAYDSLQVVSNNSDSLTQQIVGDYDFVRGWIRAAKLSHDTLNIANGSFRAFFFGDSVGIGTIVDYDTASFDESIDTLLLGYTDFTLQADGLSATADAVYDLNTGLDIPVELDRRSNSYKGIWVVLVCMDGDGYTPESGGVFKISIWVETP